MKERSSLFKMRARPSPSARRNWRNWTGHCLQGKSQRVRREPALRFSLSSRGPKGREILSHELMRFLAEFIPSEVEGLEMTKESAPARRKRALRASRHGFGLPSDLF